MTRLSLVVLLALASTILAGCNDEQASKETDKTEINTEQSEVAKTELQAAKDNSGENNAPAAIKKLANEGIEKMQNASLRAPTEITGTIVYKNLEGGFYALMGAQGGRYTLKDLPDEFKQDGIVVTVTGILLHDAMTTTQFGTLMQVTEVTMAKDTKVTAGRPQQ